MFYVWGLVITLVSSGLMYWFGKRYAIRETANLRGAIFRSTCWSIVFCWTTLLINGGVVPGIIPLPSWGAIIFWLLETTGNLDSTVQHDTGVTVQFVPHILVSPAVPLAAYLIAYKRYRDDNEAAQ